MVHAEKMKELACMKQLQPWQTSLSQSSNGNRLVVSDLRIDCTLS